MSGLFRDEALAELVGTNGLGDVLRTTPRWLSWGPWALFVLLAAGVSASSRSASTGQTFIHLLGG